MRAFAILLAAGLPAACTNTNAVNNSSGNMAAAPSGVANTIDPVLPTVPDNGAGAPPGAGNHGPVNLTAAQRAGAIQACSADLGRQLPRGTDLPGLCGCAIDRMIAGTPQIQAVQACAQQRNITLPPLR